MNERLEFLIENKNGNRKATQPTPALYYFPDIREREKAEYRAHRAVINLATLSQWKPLPLHDLKKHQAFAACSLEDSMKAQLATRIYDVVLAVQGLIGLLLAESRKFQILSLGF